MENIFHYYNQPQKNEKFKTQLILLRGHKCEKCKNTTWLNQIIKLELHHKDGDRNNYNLDNLELLCPNCHSYTDTYCIKKEKNKKDISDKELIESLKNHSTIRQALLALNLSDTGSNYQRARNLIRIHKISLLPNNTIKLKEKFCKDCGISIHPDSERCPICASKNAQTFNIEREELKALIRSTPFTTIAKKFGVTDNAIRKRCDKYKLPRHSREIKKYTDKEWELI